LAAVQLEHEGRFHHLVERGLRALHLASRSHPHKGARHTPQAHTGKRSKKKKKAKEAADEAEPSAGRST
jgi:hypothetical protein